MTTPHERLTRMRKSFEKNKTVLTADYKYFTTPNVPATPQESTQHTKIARKMADRSASNHQKES
jgi:hypothetical protein